MSILSQDDMTHYRNETQIHLHRYLFVSAVEMAGKPSRSDSGSVLSFDSVRF